ncbi:MAG: superoxide dismutase [Rhodospirillales bacterium]|nr:superoxide dismutase [Rhodospirillales bacterium]
MRKVILTGIALIAGGVVAAGTAEAATKTVTVNTISATGVGASIGTLTLRDSKQGLVVEPNLKGLPAGTRGFHLHEKGDCGPGPNPQGQPAPGLAAGGHYDPEKTGTHHGPHNKAGHLGDMSVLIVDANGTATVPVLAPRLKVKDAAGKAIMIHAGEDNYSDAPAPLGGGGARIACGVVK